MLSWLRRGGSRPAVSIDTELWREATARWLFMRGLGAGEEARLRELSERFIGAKQFSGTHGLEISDRMQVEIAAQACILILELGLDYYRGWVEVIVYPDEFVAEYEYVDEAGVAHRIEEPMTGESWERGPVILSWADAKEGGRGTGYNVVIHEFAHKLDMLNGEANGFPPLHADMNREQWSSAFSAAYEAFCRRVEGDCELEIDEYAAESPAEFFAVMSEVFFESPDVVRASFPEGYRQLAQFYRQDPAARTASSARGARAAAPA